ncbi:hypothetical protein ACUUL3_04855 [Thiovibrio sp. JS02]
MAPKDDLVKAALAYDFKENTGFDEEACNNKLCENLRNLKAGSPITCLLDGLFGEDASCKYKNYSKNPQFCCNGKHLKQKTGGDQWAREYQLPNGKRVDSAYFQPQNGKPLAELLAEVKVWKARWKFPDIFYSDYDCTRLYPFLFLNGFYDSSDGFNSSTQEIHKIENAEQRWDPISSSRTPAYPCTEGVLKLIKGKLCCFRPNGSTIVATDADEGQLFKDFVKMLNYKNNPFSMLQALYIVTKHNSPDPWGHVHKPSYILEKLNYLFGLFYEISAFTGRFQVYNYADLTLLISFKPFMPLEGTVHFGSMLSVHDHNVTPLVIEWHNHRSELGTAAASTPSTVLNPCKGILENPATCTCKEQKATPQQNQQRPKRV